MRSKIKAVVIGGSAGAMKVMSSILASLPAEYSLPIIVALHLHPLQDSYFVKHFKGGCALTVKEAEDKEAIQAGHVYFAPANYHLLVENDHTLSLSVDDRVNYSRPSIDVLFESAADAYMAHLAGVLLTGANNDGALGLKRIKEKGGLVVVQDPDTAESPYMPKTALQTTEVDYVLPLNQIGSWLAGLK
jgi:two-component system chemotaxis response regulator CheB